MRRATTSSMLAVAVAAAVACRSTAALSPTPPPRPMPPGEAASPAPQPSPPLVMNPTAPPRPDLPLTVASAPPRCSPADWSARRLAPLLASGKRASSAWPDQEGAARAAFEPDCGDSPGGARQASSNPVVFDGVEIRLVAATPAGTSRRGWAGNQCAFDVRSADGSGQPVRLAAPEIPPFTTIGAVVHSGSAAFVAVSFNGYTAEFPKGGNRILALDLCEGRVAWKSKDAMSNGGLLLLGEYLVSPYGFTSERRYVFVLDWHSGNVVQRLAVIENICPSKSWAPHWHPGERCDAPGQAVGAATAPRIEGGVLLVDTNTGSSSFQFD